MKKVDEIKLTNNHIMSKSASIARIGKKRKILAIKKDISVTSILVVKNEHQKSDQFDGEEG